MKIYYDHQVFTMQKFGGVSKYFSNLIEHLPPDYNGIMAPCYSDNIYLKEIALSNIQHFNFPKNFRIKRRLYYFLNNITHRQFLKQNDYDIYHPTYYQVANTSKPVVITLHDLIHEKFPQLFAAYDRSAQLKKQAIQRADHIICVSENTKKDLLELYPIPEQKISVVYHGYDLNQVSHLEEKENYILYVGDRGGYKNFKNFILAVSPLLLDDRSLHIICTGKPFHSGELALFDRLRISNQVQVLSNVDSKSMLQLYRKAKLFIYPSLYEGFGIPILEAFGQNCPIVLSNTSCFPEIAHDAAEYFDPDEVKSIQEAIEKVLFDEVLTKTLVEKGKLRLQNFSMHQMANNTSEIYKLFR
ncbi:glycosyltransferase family 4 protein [Sphingobacterium lumbrici]|uniref:glycosyltransferase family 4 protein n=1 Tax=Sphingobacterium lumbrici TaxID=2559600 RepID=UPI00112AA363|nr:glycosyltransferase family 1 protein [Sphingobacterium lumbrici]